MINFFSLIWSDLDQKRMSVSVLLYCGEKKPKKWHHYLLLLMLNADTDAWQTNHQLFMMSSSFTATANQVGTGDVTTNPILWEASRFPSYFWVPKYTVKRISRFFFTAYDQESYLIVLLSISHHKTPLLNSTQGEGLGWCKPNRLMGSPFPSYLFIGCQAC